MVLFWLPVRDFYKGNFQTSGSYGWVGGQQSPNFVITSATKLSLTTGTCRGCYFLCYQVVTYVAELPALATCARVSAARCMTAIT